MRTKKDTERILSMASEDGGLEDRYVVKKRSDPTGKHEKCEYFVLDPQHDPQAVLAIRAYSAAARSERPELADALDAWVGAPVSDARREDAARELHGPNSGDGATCGVCLDKVDAMLPAPPDAARLIEIVLEHEPRLDETACYDGGCDCGWKGTEREHEAHRLAAVAEALALPAPLAQGDDR